MSQSEKNTEQCAHDVFLFFGVVGAGKGTQVELLEKFLANKNEAVLNIGFGEQYRALIQSGTRMGSQLKAMIEAGKLGPNFLTNTIASNFLADHYTGKEHLIFDGYPRTNNQSNTIHEMREFFNWSTPHIIFITLSDEEAIRRLEKRGRADDSAEGIKRRLEIYRQEVVPSLKHLQTLGEYHYHEINGDQTIEAVHDDILIALGYK